MKATSAALGWFPTTPVAEREVIDMATTRQIALRHRLRLSYWLTDCQPITDVAIGQLRRKMTLIDPRDSMDDPEVQELLSPHYGFQPVCEPDGVIAGWSIPDLLNARDSAVASIRATRERMADLGRRSAQSRAAGGTQKATPSDQPAPSKTDDEF